MTLNPYKTRSHAHKHYGSPTHADDMYVTHEMRDKRPEQQQNDERNSDY